MREFLVGVGRRHSRLQRWVWPPTPGGWFPLAYLRWWPIPLRYGWVHPRFRCGFPGCWRSWQYDQACCKHFGEF